MSADEEDYDHGDGGDEEPREFDYYDDAEGAYPPLYEDDYYEEPREFDYNDTEHLQEEMCPPFYEDDEVPFVDQHHHHHQGVLPDGAEGYDPYAYGEECIDEQHHVQEGELDMYYQSEVNVVEYESNSYNQVGINVAENETHNEYHYEQNEGDVNINVVSPHGGCNENNVNLAGEISFQVGYDGVSDHGSSQGQGIGGGAHPYRPYRGSSGSSSGLGRPTGSQRRPVRHPPRTQRSSSVGGMVAQPIRARYQQARYLADERSHYLQGAPPRYRQAPTRAQQQQEHYTERRHHSLPTKMSDELDDDYDASFLDEILRTGNRKGIHGGRWNLLISGSAYTNAGKNVKHANLAKAILSEDGEVQVPSMYVKDFEGAPSKNKKSANARVACGGIASNVKVRFFSVKAKARKFHTELLDLSKLLRGCRALRDRSRYFVHRTVGQMDVREALVNVVNSGDEFELVLSKSLTKHVVDFIVRLNRVRAYGCCEVASIGGGWYALQNIEMLGPEDKGFAKAQEKGGNIVPMVPFVGGKAKRYLGEFEEARAVGTVRTGSMFEEYSSPNGQFDNAFQVTVGKLKFLVEAGAEIISETDGLSSSRAKSRPTHSVAATDTTAATSTSSALAVRKGTSTAHPYAYSVQVSRAQNPATARHPPRLMPNPRGIPSPRPPNVISSGSSCVSDISWTSSTSQVGNVVPTQSSSSPPRSADPRKYSGPPVGKAPSRMSTGKPVIGATMKSPSPSSPRVVHSSPKVMQPQSKTSSVDTDALPVSSSTSSTSQANSAAHEPSSQSAIRPQVSSGHSFEETPSLGSPSTSKPGSGEPRELPATATDPISSDPSADAASPISSSSKSGSEVSSSMTNVTSRETRDVPQFSKIETSQLVVKQPEKRVLKIWNNGQSGLKGANIASPASVSCVDGRDGQDATKPTAGGSGGDLVIALKRMGDAHVELFVTLHDPAGSGSSQERVQTFPLEELPLLDWSSLGGTGGDGGVGGPGADGKPGRNGADASQTHPGYDGDDGGNGGNGGMGTSGEAGGNGGNVTVCVEKGDECLLMALQGRKQEEIRQRVKGGAGGKKGAHGMAGKGGRGGKGGKEFKLKKKNAFARAEVIPGGKPGHKGADGNTPTLLLSNGHMGTAGSFRILVNGNEEFKRPFDLELSNLTLDCEYVIAEGIFEFGSVVYMKGLTVSNTGGMPLPAGTLIEFSVDPSGFTLVDDGTHGLCTLNMANDLMPGSDAASDGAVAFMLENGRSSPTPTTPTIRPAQLKVSATLFDYSKCFMSQFSPFHDPPRTIKFRYPLENKGGIKGFPSLGPGESAIFQYRVTNVSGFGLGSLSEGGRGVALKWSLRDCNRDGIGVENMSISARFMNADGHEDDQCEKSKNGVLMPLSFIGAHSSIEVSVELSLSGTAKHYCSAVLQAELLLQDVYSTPDNNANFDDFVIVQRGELPITCEPPFHLNEDTVAVLVTSRSTTRSQYTKWRKVLNEMSLPVEIYSLSRNGSMDPHYTVDDKIELLDAFDGKLIILLDDPFNPDIREKASFKPLHALPPGAITALYPNSTRWLIVNTKGSLSPDDILHSDPGKEGQRKTTRPFGTLSACTDYMLQQLHREAASGIPRSDLGGNIYKVTNIQTSKSVAAAQAEFMVKNDGIRQYSVVYGATAMNKLEIYHEYNHYFNPGVVVSNCAGPSAIEQPSMLLAIAEALSPESVALHWSQCIRHNASQDLLRAFRTAATGGLIRDVCNLLDGSFALDDDIRDCFPTLSAFTDNIEILCLVRDCQQDAGLKKLVESEFSDLLGRFEAIAISKDLRPRNPLKKVSTGGMHESLVSAVARIRRQWRGVADSQKIERIKNRIKSDLKSLLGVDDPNKRVNVRADKVWLNGLAFLHSSHNEGSYKEKGPLSTRIVELSQGVSKMSISTYKISSPYARIIESNEFYKRKANAAERAQRYSKVSGNGIKGKIKSIHEPSPSV